MSKHRNPNYDTFRRTVESMRGKVTDFRLGRKHFIAYVTTARGHHLVMPLSKAPMPAGAVEFYTIRTLKREDKRRQQVTRRVTDKEVK